MRRTILVVLLFVSLGLHANPVVRGTWKGLITQYNADSSSFDMPCTIFLNDDDSNGDLAGEMVITYTYKNGKNYYCKAKVSGKIDYKTYEFSLVMEEFVYYDLLPENMKWCLGTIAGAIRREMEIKRYLVLGWFTTNCADGKSKVLLVKQE